MPRLHLCSLFFYHFILQLSSTTRCNVEGLSSFSRNDATFITSKSSPTNVSWRQIEIPHAPSRTPEKSTSLAGSSSIGDSIKSGESVLLLENLASSEECHQLLSMARDSVPEKEHNNIPMDKPGLIRIPTSHAYERASKTKTPCAPPLVESANEICQTILHRAFQCIDRDQPTISENLFSTNSLEKLFLEDQLHWSSREPAVNIYTNGGEFLAHKDAQSLTILLSITCPETSFGGGGTAFWSQDARGHRVEEPGIILKPKMGTAILFGGCVTHAGVAISSGIRGVLVASFSSDRKDCQTEQRDIYGDSM